jgi:hypothetical protein
MYNIYQKIIRAKDSFEDMLKCNRLKNDKNN